MDSSEAKAKVKGVVDKVFEVSKEAIGKAGNAVQKFSDTSVIKIEIRQFESKLKAQKALLGDVVEKALENNQSQLDLNTEEITAAHAKGGELNLEYATSITDVPYHAGAAKYFKEKNVTVESK